MRIEHKGLSITIFSITSNSFGDQIINYVMFNGTMGTTQTEVNGEGSWMRPEVWAKQLLKAEAKRLQSLNK